MTLALVLVVAPSGRAEGPPAGGTISFDRDVRPILSDRCFTCHGPDDAERKAGLRLDTKEAALAEMASGSRAIVPSSPDESEVIFRITTDDPTLVMPPPRSGKTLTPDEVRKLTAWVEQGADYRTHWAFVPPVRPELPKVKDLGWCRNPIDRFVLAKLEAEGLKPSAEADRMTLARRLALDLTGLPPEVADADALAAATDEASYTRYVDRLLDSPHYGERWGRTWLDAARYADSDGYEKDKARSVWFYRDWVVSAFNRDLPYNQFIIEQIAGDLLPGATQDQRVATGFLRNSMINEEGGIDPEQFRMEAMFDRMDAVGTGILALTVKCAQCHTHKYDPITHTDYYQMFAFLNNSHEASVAAYTPEQERTRADVFRRIREIEDQLKHHTPDWAERMASWEETAKVEGAKWDIVRPELDTSGGQKHELLDDGSILAQGYAPTKHTTEFPVTFNAPRTVSAIRLELLNDPNLPLSGPGRSIHGLFALTEFKVTLATPDAQGKPGATRDLKVQSATADVEQEEKPLDSIFDDKTKKRRVTGPVSYAIDGKDETAWGIDIGPGRRNVPRKAVFVLDEPVAMPAGSVLTFKLVQNHGGWNSDDNQNNNLGRFRFSMTDSKGAVADPVPAAVRAVLARGRDDRSPEQVDLVFSHWRTTQPDWKAENDRIEAIWREHPEGASQLVVARREVDRPTSRLERGEFLKPAERVGPGVPSFLNPLPEGDPANRLAFAKWMVDRRAPTTARAIVNRVWQGYFGTGIVATAEDLGSQAEVPSHPELLDWLAVELMESGWGLKHLHRLIVSSATYRQASTVTPELAARDPYNRLLARGPRFRVDAEVVRDIALTASGLLDRTIGGPSVQPPAPAFLFLPPASYGPKVWNEAKGSERYRRALYTFRFRSVPYPMLQAFDAPNGDVSCVRRGRSNTPLQALTTLNEPVFLDCARSLGLKAMSEGGPSDPDRVTWAFRRALTRPPTDTERNALLSLLERQAERFRAPDAKPWELAAEDPARPPSLPEGETPARAAAWVAVARVVLNLDETITKE
jgi:hypothetical protein